MAIRKETKMRANELSKRLPQGAPTQLGVAICDAFSIVERFKAKADMIRRDPTLSRAGIAAAISKARNGGFGEHLGQLQRSVKVGLDSVRLERAQMCPVRPDKSDTVGEMRRASIRTFLRSLPQGERMRLAQTTTDREIVEAILHAPAELTGLPREVHAAIVDKEIEVLHGARLAQLKTLETAYEETDAALQVAANDMDSVARDEGVSA
jgi:hypothetical protein